MQKSFFILPFALVLLVGCNKASSPAASVRPSGDAVQQALQQDAGSGATDCGRLSSQAPDQLKKASDCAMQAAQAKQPFYVAYDMPGLTVAVAGNSEGKLYFVSSNQGEGGQPEVKNGPCEAALRVAQSGRVTCVSAASFGMGMNPHGEMPAGMANPHTGGMTMPPPGTPNPHEGGSGMETSHGTASKPPKQ
jgi:hypothetical protein